MYFWEDGKKITFTLQKELSTDIRSMHGPYGPSKQIADIDKDLLTRICQRSNDKLG